jgi:hypothetical protein
MQRGGPGFEAGPNGNDNYRNGAFGPGQLVGRIGKNGKQFNVGEKFKGVPGESGKLYLRAHPGPWGQMTGSYSIKVIAGSAVEGDRLSAPVKPTPKTSKMDVPKIAPPLPK